RPFISGRSRSRTHRSNAPVRSSARPAVPSPAASTRNPSSTRPRVTVADSARSSSTSSTREPVDAIAGLSVLPPRVGVLLRVRLLLGALLLGRFVLDGDDG